jgi:hypothetical protein
MDENLSTPRQPTSDGFEPVIVDGQELDAEAEKRNVAHEVYLEVSTSFYTWERGHASQTLAGLARNHAKRKPKQRPRRAADLQNQDSGEKISFIFEEFTSSSHTASGIRRTYKHRIASEPILRADPSSFEPYPRYTACTPTSTNLTGPLNAHLRASFAPFADDGSFKLELYLANFEDFIWQSEYPDPDCICPLIYVL